MPNRCGKIHWLGGGGDLGCGGCSRCWCIDYLMRERPNCQLNKHRRRVDVGNSRLWRILLLGSAAVPLLLLLVLPLELLLLLLAVAFLANAESAGKLPLCSELSMWVLDRISAVKVVTG